MLIHLIDKLGNEKDYYSKYIIIVLVIINLMNLMTKQLHLTHNIIY